MDQADIPREAKSALRHLRRRLGPSLVSVYLHGSAVTEGLRAYSDVDLLAATADPLPLSTRLALSADLLAVSGLYPSDPRGRRPLEVIIVRQTDLEQMPYPMRAEFVYGEWLRQSLQSGGVPEAETNADFTLLLAQARQAAVPLIGPDIADLVPPIPQSTIRRAIGDALPSLLASVEGDERNVLLTMARMWRTLTTGEFVSKRDAAAWACARLSGVAAGSVEIAGGAYLGLADDDLHLRPREVSEAVEEMRERILAALHSS